MTPKTVEYYLSMSHHRKKYCTTYIIPVNNGINYQPQLVNARISESSNLWGYLSTLQSQLWACWGEKLSSNCRFCKYVQSLSHMKPWRFLIFLRYICNISFIIITYWWWLIANLQEIAKATCHIGIYETNSCGFSNMTPDLRFVKYDHLLTSGLDSFGHFSPRRNAPNPTLPWDLPRGKWICLTLIPEWFKLCFLVSVFFFKGNVNGCKRNTDHWFNSMA